jgi:hypothetical protein
MDSRLFPKGARSILLQLKDYPLPLAGTQEGTVFPMTTGKEKTSVPLLDIDREIYLPIVGDEDEGGGGLITVLRK